MAEKRSRNPNFTKDEKVTLLTIVAKYKNVIENKKTDHITWREKDQAWETIYKEFNFVSPAGFLRSVETLRKLYDNIKKNTRKAAAQEKLAVKKTGGGRDNITNDTTYDLALSIVNRKSVFGLNNSFDCDSQNINDSLNNNAEKDTAGNEITENNNEEIEVEIETNSEYFIESTDVDWGSYKPIDLQTPACSKLQKSKLSTSNNCLENVTGEKTESESLLSGNSKKSWLKRRRPVSATQNKNDLSVMYKEIGDVKLEYYKSQLEDLNKRREREQDEHEWKKEEYVIKKKILLLDAKIKEEQLKSILSSTF